MAPRTCRIAAKLSWNPGLFGGEAEIGGVDESSLGEAASYLEVASKTLGRAAEREDVPALHLLGDGCGYRKFRPI